MKGKLQVGVVLLFLISSVVLTTLEVNTDSAGFLSDRFSGEMPLNIEELLPAEGVHRNIRIAIYNEPAKALPSYASAGTPTNNYTVVQTFLESEGYTVEVLQYIEILSHELTTAAYDVFIIADALPRDNVAYLIKDFWLGGGSILSFNTAMGYLCYFGLLTGVEGDYGWGSNWMYASFDDGTINARHPAAKGYHIGDTVTDTLGSRVIINNAGLSGIIGNDYADLAYDADDVSDGIACAVDNHRQGGKIVHLPGNCSTIPLWIQNILPDVIDWLAPKPKGRILFDFSHEPFVGVDEWDPPTQPYYFSEWRNAIVNRSYMFDKLHPSTEGNLTLSNLEPYDMLVISLPDLNFSIQEVADIQIWISNGGSLFICVEAPGSGNPYLVRANQILEPTGIVYNMSLPYFDGIATKVDDHPVLEECNALTYFIGSLVNLSGSAIPLWDDGTGNFLVAASEYGDGRIIATGDTNFLLNGWIEADDNIQFTINAVNWLSSSKAEVLLYTTEQDAPSYYRTPVANALNDLGVSFYLTGESSYMNLSLHEYAWELVILDGPRGTMSAYYDEIRDYVRSNGILIMSDYQVDDYSSHPLWATLGFQYASDAPEAAPVFIRNPSSDLFQIPNVYGSTNFTPFRDYGDEGDQLEVLANGTAIVYYTPTFDSGTAAIVIGLSGRSLYNGYLIDQFQEDLDDSTYMDAFELWENEIAYMLQPLLGVPFGETYTEGETGNRIIWQAHSLFPWTYSVKRDTEILYTEVWDSIEFWDSIVVDIDGLSAGIYQYEMTITDRAGQWRTTSAQVRVLEVTETTTNYTIPSTNTTIPDGTDFPISYAIILVILVGGVVYIVITLIRKLRSP